MTRRAGITTSAMAATGYPRGLATVGVIAHVVCAADAFTAKISARALRQPLLPP